MTRPPYSDARPSTIPAHSDSWPHPSWLNEAEIYFSIVQRKGLSPRDFPSLNALAERLPDFQSYWESTAKFLEWKFNRQDLEHFLFKHRQQQSLVP
jgi:hypothetical protein